MKYAIIALFLMLGSATASAQTTGDPKIATVDIITSAVCGMCEETIETALLNTKGVITASLNVETKVVTVQYRPKKATVENLRAAINQAGYDADETLAVPAAYDNLNPCCKKGAHD